MVDYHLPLDWTLLHSLTNDATLRNYRKGLSRVSKPSSSTSSAGSSPHSHSTSHATTYPRRRTMTNFDNGVAHMHPARNLFSISPSSSIKSRQRTSRPLSWHPSVRAAAGGAAQQANYYMPNCHPSWFHGDLSTTTPTTNTPPLEPAQPSSGISSMYGLSTPITCPVSGDLLSTNDYFGSPQVDNASYNNNFIAPRPQVYTPVEPSDNMLYSDLPEWQPCYSMESTPVSAYPWMQYNFNGPISTDRGTMDFGGHESVASTDDFTAPPTPEVFNYSQPGTQYHLPTVMPATTQDDLPADGNNDNCGDAGGDDDDLVAVGLYDEPSMLSLSLLGGTDSNSCHSTGKGLKLEETFTPADDHEDDAEGEEDD